MSKAFSLIELVFALIILALLFSLFYLYIQQIQKNTQSSYQAQRLFEAEKDLRMQNFSQNSLLIELKNLGKAELLENQNEDFKSLKPLNEDYKRYFTDEKSF